MLARLRRGRAEKSMLISMLITGLRGVGKTVLLNTFEAIAEEARLPHRQGRDHARDRLPAASSPSPSATPTSCRSTASTSGTSPPAPPSPQPTSSARTTSSSSSSTRASSGSASAAQPRPSSLPGRHGQARLRAARRVARSTTSRARVWAARSTKTDTTVTSPARARAHRRGRWSSTPLGATRRTPRARSRQA